MAIKVVLVDDHPVLRAGIRAILDSDTNLDILAEATDGLEAIQMVKKHQPDVVIMDITMPNLNGIEATKQITTLSPNTKVLALSIHSGKRFVKNMLNAGAAGYLLKDSVPEELLSAIQKIFNGEMYLSSLITKIALSKDSFESETGRSLPILKTKLNRPPITNDYLLRSAIIEQLEEHIDKPFTLVSAPAGFGKSITISQWFENTKFKNSWISLDEEHNDLRVFLLYLLTSIESIFPNSLKETVTLINTSEFLELKILSNTFINELDKVEESFIIALDNYHKINESQVNDFINELLNFSPQNMHLVILTRRDPSLNLSSLRVLNRMNELRMNELRFSKAEVEDLYNTVLNIKLNVETINTLLDKTEGWIVGLRLASLEVKKLNNPNQILSDSNIDFNLVSEFMIKDLLSTQTSDIQKKLFVSSILDRFCSELIDELFSDGNQVEKINSKGNDFLNELVKANLFIIPLDNENKWFRYHQLFKGMLNKQLNQRLSGNEIKVFCLKASKWYEIHGFIEEAFNQALLAEDFKRAIQIIEENRHQLIQQNKWHILEKLLSELPTPIIENNIELLLAEVYIHFYHNRINLISNVLDQIDELNSDKNHYPDEIAWFRNYSFYMNNFDEVSLKSIGQILNQVKKEDIELLGLTQSFFALLSQMEGQLESANSKLLSWLGKSKSLTPLYENRLIISLVIVHFIAANPKGAERYLKNGRNDAMANNLKGALAWCEYITGLCHLQRCEFNLAIQHLKKGVDLRSVFHTRSAIDALASLALAYQANNLAQDASKTLETLFEFTDLLGPQYSVYADSCSTRLEMMNEPNNVNIQLHESNISFTPKAMLFWFDFPAVTFCRKLISEGTPGSLKKAEKHLKNFIVLNEKHHNTYKQIIILALQALLFEKQKKTEKALETLAKSLYLAEPGNFIFTFVELGQAMVQLINKLPKEIANKKFILRIIDLIKNKKEIIGSEEPEFKKVVSSKNRMLSLTSREIEVLTYVAKGLRNKEIAGKMYVSNDTIKKHIYNMSQKLGVNNRISLVSKATELGLLNE